jgi:pyruvate dehydrogenase E2 component (dihydrolipoamide acetyltransferase)
MPSNVYLPQAGETVTEGRIQAWLKQEGDLVAEGEKICEVMTSKLVIDVKSPAAGKIFRVFADVDEVVEVGKVIAVIQLGNETLDPEEIARLPERHRGAKERAALAPPPVAAARAVIQAEPAQVSAVQTEEPREIIASPVARKMAEEAGIDLGNVTGTGPRGRITKEDVLEFLARPQPAKETPKDAPVPSEAPPFTVVKIAGIRKIIAERLRQSVAQKPHICFEAKVRVDGLLELRSAMSKRYDRKISLNAMIMYFYVHMLRKFPILNAHVVGDEIRQFQKVNLGMAVARKEGLIVPVIHDAGNRNILELDEMARDLGEKARAGTLSMAEISGGTVTVSNLGMYGVRNFNAIINPPEVAILAVGGLDEQLCLEGDGKVVPARYMSLNLCVDHCAIDGDMAASAIMTVKDLMENPAIVIFER